jgi:hypothetical protein
MSLNRPSNLLRRKLCPGSALRESVVSEKDAANGIFFADSEASAEGTLLHHLDANPKIDRSTLNGEQRRALESNELLREAAFRKFREELGIPEDAEYEDIVEKEFYLCDKLGIPVEPAFSGHPDRIRVWKSHKLACIADSKFGRLPVTPSESNLQLRAYFVCFVDSGMALEKVGVAITQPWLRDFSLAIYNVADVDEWRDELLKIIAATKADDAPVNPSIEACRYCTAIGACEPAKQVLKELTAQRINDLSIEELESLGESILISKSIIEQWTTRMKLIAAKYPTLVKRFKLQSTGSTYAVESNERAVELLSSAGLLHENISVARMQMLECTHFSLPELSELVAKNVGISEKEAREKIVKALSDAGALEVRPKEQSLVPVFSRH